MPPCLFCKIIAQEIPNYTVFENEYVLAFLDIHPCSTGHTVVVPKKHFATVEEMATTSDWPELMQGLQATVRRLNEVIKPDGLNIGLNNGAAAGQAVPHLHWHLIPRAEGDGGGSMHSIIKKSVDTTVEEVAELFKKN